MLKLKQVIIRKIESKFKGSKCKPPIQRKVG